MSFGVLSLVCLVALLGPILALDPRWRLPVVLGELLAGALLGTTGFGWLDPAEPTFAFLAAMGFVLVMFVAATHVPMRDPRVAATLAPGASRVLLVALVAGVLGYAVAAWAGTGHAALYAVLMASSSAALVLPIVSSLQLEGGDVAATLTQVALADTLCIVALPLVLAPDRVGRAALGAAAVVAAGATAWVVLRWLDRRGVRRRLHSLSERRLFALELRVNLVILFALAALASSFGVSVMLAGFVFGLAVSAVGEPRRLARQLFGIADGFLGPLFFVWLGASLDVRSLAGHPRMILLGLLLGLGAVVAHLSGLLLRQPLGAGMLSAAQLGVPVAAATIGTQLGLLQPGEASALLLGGGVTLVATAWGSSLLARSGPPTAVGAHR